MDRGGCASRRRRSLIAAAGLATLLRPRTVNGSTRHQLRFVVGADATRHADAMRAIRDRLGDVPVEDLARRRLSGARPTAYLALGPSGLQAAINARLDAPVVSLFSSRQTYERIGGTTPTPERTAVYAEPNPEHQMRLIAAIYRRSVSVGALLSEWGSQFEGALRDAAMAHGLRLHAARVPAGTGVSRALNALESVSAVLIQPDSDLYTQETLRELLESTYRRRLPVIGFSAALVAAGTMASASSSFDDIANQLEGTLDSIARGRVPPPQYPAYWSVVVNDSVARSLDVVIDRAARGIGDRP